MLSTFWTTALAGVDGRGSSAVRPSLLAASCGPEGTGLPTSGMPVVGVAPRLRDGAVCAFGTGVRIDRGTALLITTRHDQITENDGTTLGFHSSGRPRS